MVVGRKRLLTKKEKTVCEGIVLLKKGLASKRAAVLLAVNEGMIQPEAARKTGLTIGQLRYAMILFRKKKMAMFSEELRQSAMAATAHSEGATVARPAVKAAPQEKKDKPKKPKKDSDKSKSSSKKGKKKKDKAAKKLKDKGKKKKDSKKKTAKKDKKKDSLKKSAEKSKKKSKKK